MLPKQQSKISNQAERDVRKTMQDNSMRKKSVGRAVAKTGKEAKQTLTSEVQASLKWGKVKKWKGK